jgi:hypothetical protein
MKIRKLLNLLQHLVSWAFKEEFCAKYGNYSICGPFNVCINADPVGALVSAGAHCGSYCERAHMVLMRRLTLMHSTQSVLGGL